MKRSNRLSMPRTSLGSSMKIIFFFFSSRRRHTRLQGDWSSDVCSSDLLDLVAPRQLEPDHGKVRAVVGLELAWRDEIELQAAMRQLQWGAGWLELLLRSEERRVGEEGRSRWSPYQ